MYIGPIQQIFHAKSHPIHITGEGVQGSKMSAAHDTVTLNQIRTSATKRLKSKHRQKVESRG